MPNPTSQTAPQTLDRRSSRPDGPLRWPDDFRPKHEPVEELLRGIESVDFARREVAVIAAPYNSRTQGPVLGPDGRYLLEEIEPNAFDGIDRDVTVNRDHDQKRVVGRVVDFEPTDPRGLITLMRISRTPLGDETLQLAADRVLKASVNMTVRRMDQRIVDGIRRIKRAFLGDHIALLPYPAYGGAQVLAVRQGDQSDQEVGEVVATPNLDAILSTVDSVEAIVAKHQRR